MISNSNRSGTVGTKPDSRERQDAGKPPKEAPKKDAGVVKAHPDHLIVAKDGRLHVESSKSNNA